MKISETHYRYWIAILIGMLILFITRDWRTIDKVAELLSFGVGITSLVVSVIAIIQALIAGNATQSAAAELYKSLSAIQNASLTVTSAANTIEKQISVIHPEIVKVSSSIAGIFGTRNTVSIPNSIEKQIGPDILTGLSNIGTLIFYSMCLGYEKRKSLKIEDIYESIKSLSPEDATYKDFVTGFLGPLHLCNSFDIRCTENKVIINEIDLTSIQVKEKLLARSKGRDHERLSLVMAAAELYISELQSSSESPT